MCWVLFWQEHLAWPFLIWMMFVLVRGAVCYLDSVWMMDEEWTRTTCLHEFSQRLCYEVHGRLFLGMSCFVNCWLVCFIPVVVLVQYSTADYPQKGIVLYKLNTKTPMWNGRIKDTVGAAANQQ